MSDIRYVPPESGPSASHPKPTYTKGTQCQILTTSTAGGAEADVSSVKLIGLVLARIRASDTCAAPCGDGEQFLHAEVDWIDSDGCFDLDGGQSWVAVRRC